MKDFSLWVACLIWAWLLEISLTIKINLIHQSIMILNTANDSLIHSCSFYIRCSLFKYISCLDWIMKNLHKASKSSNSSTFYLFSLDTSLFLIYDLGILKPPLRIYGASSFPYDALELLVAGRMLCLDIFVLRLNGRKLSTLWLSDISIRRKFSDIVLDKKSADWLASNRSGGELSRDIAGKASSNFLS